MTPATHPVPAMLPIPAADSFAMKVRGFAAASADGTGVTNSRARIEVLGAGDDVLPVGIVDGADGGEAWVSSPRRTYGAYAMEECGRHFPALRSASALCGAGLDRVFARGRIDHVVVLNQWLLATTLYPPLRDTDIAAHVAAARARWPTHALWWRSLNDVHHRDWLEALERLGFRRVPSRQVWLVEAPAEAARQHANAARDLRMLDDGRFARAFPADIGDGDDARIADLYAQLYRQKYSRFNPVYDAGFIRRWRRAGLLRLRGARDAGGELVAVAGLFMTGDLAVTPIVGYDLARPAADALYRRAMAEAMAAAIEAGKRLHLSAGAADFKRLRGAIPAIEYSLVDARGAATATRRTVGVLASLADRVGVPLLRRYGL